jgi:Flp pilus assembly protein TadD
MSEQRGGSVGHQRGKYLRYWLFITLFGSTAAFGECEQAAGRLESSEGTVSIEHAGNWQQLAIGACVPAGVRVQVSGGRAVFLLANETLLRASGNTLLHFNAPEKKGWIHLFEGVLHFITRTPHAFDVETDYVNAGVKGTEFILAANRNEHYGQVVMVEGEVLASNEKGQQGVRGGEAVIARQGQAPQLLTVPAIRDAVQWTLYYPPVPAVSESRFRPVRERLYRSDAAGAMAQLEALPATGRDADYFALAAAVDLHRGEVVRAREELSQALASQPDHPAALALSVIGALATGDAEGASSLLRQAQAKTPNDAATLIARSYLEQSRFELSAALKSAQQAAKVRPDDALIQARVAELALMNSDTRQADNAAKKSIEQQPDFARAHAIDGFVRLQQLKFDAAEAAFKRAAALDRADPLPRLGLGLINIRHNRVSEGREQLAVAVALDPGQSLLRSYLGKAYQEEGRERLASDQYALAKTFDKADPTPWFYSALLARTQNRPFDALDDLNQSIARNDNRAVYRSRLQLDADEAARTASQAEIYRELGFDELARITASYAVGAAPGEYGGHRQLAEAYADDSQYDAARASEVLQAQLLQPLSATPIMPLLGEANLLATEGAGPSALGFREYNAMFVRERPWVMISGLGGSNGTGADEIALSGIYDRVAYAFNQYHYETTGYGDNNYARYNILSGYTKIQANEDISFLLQAAQREEDTGNLNETIFRGGSESHIRTSRADTVLLGGHARLTDDVGMIASVGYQELKDKLNIVEFEVHENSTGHSSNAEVQWQIGNIPGLLLAGANYSELDVEVKALEDPFAGWETSDNTDKYQSGYAYWNLPSFSKLRISAGVSYAELDSGNLVTEFSDWYPKLSLVYSVNSRLNLRVAYFEALTRPLNMGQTLEPTQVGGFNQLNDEVKGVDSENYGVAVDYGFGERHKFGVEAVSRNTQTPIFVTGDLHEIRGDQDLYRVFWNATWNPWAVSLGYQYDKIEHESPFALPIINLLKIETMRVPLQIGWLSESGFTVSTVATYFDQTVDEFSGASENSRFALLDLTASYLFFDRHFEVELGCNNISDRKFRYQSVGIFDASLWISPYIPERTLRAGIKFVY